MATREAPTILIVDDDRAVQRLLADALAQQGFSVAVERDGEWAIDTFNKRQVDAIVLDLLLPAINGYEVARIIRSTPRGRDTPIVMISGVYKSESQRKEAVEKHGAVAFIEKPIRLAALIDALRSALGDRYPQSAAQPGRPQAAQPETSGPTAEKLADPQDNEEAGLVERHSEQPAAASGIHGDFRERPFPEVLAEIFHWRGTGALLLRRDKVKKIVYFRDGQPLSIKSNLLSECLGQVMVGERLISPAQFEESTRRMKATHRRQGAILIEMGSISPQNLVYALNLQLRIKLFEVFSWERGDFRFNPGVAPPAETINLEMSTAAVIYEGVRRHFDVDRLRKVLGDADELLVERSSDPAYPLFDAGVGEEEQLLLQAMDGHKTVAELRALELLSPLDTDRLIYAMKCAGLVELKARTVATAASATAEPPLVGAPATAEPELIGAPPTAEPELIGEATPVSNPAAPPSAQGDEASSQAEAAGEQTISSVNGPESLVSPDDAEAALRGRVGELGLAEAKFQLGEELLKEHKYEDAHRLFEEAVRIYDQGSQFHAYLGWSKFQMQPGDPLAAEAALGALQKAIDLNPTADKSYLFSGYIYKALGRMEQAETHFAKAIQCNPDCEEAAEELKSLARRAAES
ncbi:MAG TPA: response regulator [Myxococcaceae bacterium]|nr:response regulator [Myxococcaceae bacterium]